MALRLFIVLVFCVSETASLDTGDGVIKHILGRLEELEERGRLQQVKIETLQQQNFQLKERDTQQTKNVLVLEKRLSQQSKRIADLEGIVSHQNNHFTSFEKSYFQEINRLKSLEKLDTKQNKRLATIDEHDSQQNKRLATLEEHDSRQNKRLATFEEHYSKKNERLATIEKHDSQKRIPLTSTEEWDSAGHDSDKTSIVDEALSTKRGEQKRQIDLSSSPVGISRSTEGTIAFFASLSDHMYHMGVRQAIEFDKIITNYGQAYHPSTGIFTAPVSGIYVFSTTILGYYTTTEYEFAVNGQRMSRMYVNAETNVHQTTSQTAIVHLNQGDDVSIRNMDADKMTHGHEYSTLSGFLLAPDN